MNDPYLWHRNHDVAVEVDVWGSHRQVAPLMDELGKHFGDIRTRRQFAQPMTGATTGGDWALAPEIVLWITALGGAEVLRRFLGSLADDAYRSLRNKLLRHARQRIALRRIEKGVLIRVGSHRFVFSQSITDQEFRRQLGAAQELVGRSPASVLAAEDADDEHTLWLWDKSDRRWRTPGVRLAGLLGEEPLKLD